MYKFAVYQVQDGKWVFLVECNARGKISAKRWASAKYGVDMGNLMARQI